MTLFTVIQNTYEHVILLKTNPIFKQNMTNESKTFE